MIKSILYPLRKNKLLFQTNPIFDYKDLQFKQFYLNLLPNPYVSLLDKLDMLKSFEEIINWDIKTKEGLNILSMVLVNEFTPHQKRFSKDLEYKLYENYLDNLSNYIVEQMLKRKINPINHFFLNNQNINNFDQIVFFGLEKTLKSIIASPFKPANLNIYLTVNDFLYPYEKPTYYVEECKNSLSAFFSLVENDRTDILDIFISQGLDINFKNKKNENAFFYATSATMVDYLISNGISNQSEKNTEDLYAKQFIKNRVSFLKMTESEINKMTGSMNAHFEIPDEEVIEKLLSSFGNDNFTNFRKLVNNNPKVFRLNHGFTCISVQELYNNNIISESNTRMKKFSNLDIIQSIMLCLWDGQYKISNYQDKFYSKLLLLLKGKLNIDKDYLNQKCPLGITNAELMLVSIFIPFNENLHGSEKDTSLLKLRMLINEKSDINVPTLIPRYNDTNPIPTDYFILFYKALTTVLDNFGNLVFSRFTMGKVRNVLDKKYYTGDLRKSFEEIYIRILMKRTAEPYGFNNMVPMESSDSFFNEFCKVWDELLKHMTNANKLDNANKTRSNASAHYDLLDMTENNIKIWLKENEQNIVDNMLINRLVQQIPDSVLYDKMFNPILENIMIKAKGTQSKSVSKNNIKRL